MARFRLTPNRPGDNPLCAGILSARFEPRIDIQDLNRQAEKQKEDFPG